MSNTHKQRFVIEATDTRPRNRLAVLAHFRHAGAHQKTHKARRRLAKQRPVELD